MLLEIPLHRVVLSTNRAHNNLFKVSEFECYQNTCCDHSCSTSCPPSFMMVSLSSLAQPPIHYVAVGVMPYHLVLESSCALSAVDLAFECNSHLGLSVPYWSLTSFFPPRPLSIAGICLVVPTCISRYTRWREAKSQMRMSHCDVVRPVCLCACTCSATQLCLTLRPPWTVAHQAPLSMEFSRQETFVK